MFKKILWLFILIPGWITCCFAQKEIKPVSVKKVQLGSFNRVIIHSDVTVMLTEAGNAHTARIEGSEVFLERIMMLQRGDDLVIQARGVRDLKKKGVIYIPVNGLKSLELHAGAAVMSSNTLVSPLLNILVNGNCIVDIVLKGKMKIQESEGYAFTIRRVYSPDEMIMFSNQ